MNRARRHAAALVETLRHRAPARYELARRVSIASRIDQPFLRAVRLALVPAATTRDEVELWFSPLVERFSVEGFVLLPEVANLLRDSLRGQPALVQAAHQLLVSAHRHLAPVVQLEERMTAEALAGKPLEQMAQTFAPALRGVFNPQRRALSRWVQRALPRLPPEVQQLPQVEACQARGLLLNALPETEAGIEGSDWRQVVRFAEGRVPLWLCHSGHRLQFSLTEDRRRYAQVIEIAAATPQLVQVSSRAGTRLLRLTEGGPVSVPVEPGPIQVSFADSQSLRITPRLETERSGQPLQLYAAYRRADSEQVQPVLDLLPKFLHGPMDWVNEATELPAGKNWAAELIARLESADLMLPLIADSWLQPTRPRESESHDWVTAEIEAALARDIPVLPVQFATPDSGRVPPLPASLATMQTVTIDPRSDPKEQIERLGRAIASRVRQRRTPLQPTPFRAFRDRLPDGSLGPEMVILPAGRFRMGADSATDPMAAEDEQPVRVVTIAEPFAIGRYPVTFAEIDRFAEATGQKYLEDEGWGRERRPAIKVNWDSATNYARWLSEMTGRDYRLPSEAEWEYACRAGTTTPWFWGSGPKQAERFAWFSENSEKQTHPVGLKEPNPWGLHDMAGNVWEWVQDCWHDNYQGAPVDGSAWLGDNGGDRSRRVLRGGSWLLIPDALRAAFRDYANPDYRGDRLGFRVVCRPHAG